MIQETKEFKEWIKGLRDRAAVGFINLRLRKLSQGHAGDAEPVGDGISELRIHYGPGYRVYYKVLSCGTVILCGGDKSDQSKNISKAKVLADKLK